MKLRGLQTMDDCSSNLPLRGQVAIVTGGSRGIGHATCVAMKKAGANVVVVGTDPERVDNTVCKISAYGDLSEAPLGLVLDVTMEHDMEEMARRTLARFGRIDTLVSSAGIGKRRDSTRFAPYSFIQLPTDEWDAVLDTNLKGTFLANRAVLPAMIQQGCGTIINISSFQSGRKGQPFAPAYSASKFAVVGLSQALAEEVCSDGVRVEVLFPDVTDTALLQNTALSYRFGPLLSAERIAAVIVYMAGLQDDCVTTDLGVTSFVHEDSRC